MAWWIWVVLGIILCLLELAIPAFFILWFGLAAIATGATLYLWPSLPIEAQLAIFILLSIAFVAGWFYLFRSRFRSDSAITGDSEAIGERGTVTVSAPNPGDIGRARFVSSVLGEEIWDIKADVPLHTGNPVRVVAVITKNDKEGGKLRLLKVERVF